MTEEPCLQYRMSPCQVLYIKSMFRTFEIDNNICSVLPLTPNTNLQHLQARSFIHPDITTSIIMCFFSHPKKHHHSSHGHSGRYVEETIYSPRPSRSSHHHGGRSSYTSVTRTSHSPRHSYSTAPVYQHHRTTRKYVV